MKLGILLLDLISLNDIIFARVPGVIEDTRELCLISGLEGRIFGLLTSWSSPYLQLETWFELHQDLNNVCHLAQQDGTHWQLSFYTSVGIDSFKIHS